MTHMGWEWGGPAHAALQRFLNDRGILHGPITTRPIGDGHSNLTFLVTDGTDRVVVRRPPPPPLPPGANDMLREVRLLTALSPTAVPVPQVLAVAQAGEVIDVPCYVMTFVAGPVVTTGTPAPLDTPEQRRSIATALVDTLADLHQVDWRAVGLTDLGRPDGFNARHLSRMRRLLGPDDTPLPDGFAEVHSWLRDNVPAESGAALIHGDFRIGNVVLAPDPPGRVAAVLDWELATVGDPLQDLGYFLATYPQPGARLNPVARLGAALLEPGYPARSELAARYADRTGADLRGLAWYTTFALWKLAVLYEYSRRRAEAGIGDPYYADSALVADFLADAWRTCGLESART
ncbi:phosphotransferase [Mycolicibacterium phlei RIVM601174]|nr:phosphotransferase [Mycolicibacterium phlei RIVM601174]MDA4087374.1 phosphotransferase [Mycolicibacterium hassiacum DSM 44199]